jgi:hypothetical protein
MSELARFLPVLRLLLRGLPRDDASSTQASLLFFLPILRFFRLLFICGILNAYLLRYPPQNFLRDWQGKYVIKELIQTIVMMMQLSFFNVYISCSFFVSI